MEERRLAYEASGTATAGTVLALHSLGTDHRLWDRALAALPDAGFRVVTPDARGHGASADRPLEDARGWVDDLVAVLDHAGTGPVHVLGVSMGCAQALELALQEPARVRSLVLTGGFGHLDEDTARAKAEALCKGAESEGLGQWARRYAADTLVTDDPRAVAVVRDAIASMSLGAYTSAATACFAPRTGPLAGIDVPALVVWGTHDHKTPEELSVQLAADLPRSRLLRLAGAGHLAPLDAPEDFAAVTVAFLREVTAGEAPARTNPGRQG